MEVKKNTEFEILGYRVKFNPADSSTLSADEIVEYVRNEANEIKNRYNLEAGEASVLTALKIASDKLALERELKEDLDELRETTIGVMKSIEDVTTEAPKS